MLLAAGACEMERSYNLEVNQSVRQQNDPFTNTILLALSPFFEEASTLPFPFGLRVPGHPSLDCDHVSMHLSCTLGPKAESCNHLGHVSVLFSFVALCCKGEWSRGHWHKE